MTDKARRHAPSRLPRRKVLAAGAVAPLIAAAAGRAKPAAAPLAMTVHGPVRGYRDGAINVFKGVRYGADTRPRRFERPARPQGWQEPVEAVDYGPACPQRGAREAISEDCLFLNVWTPGLADGGKRPVMVYFHGGAYNSGSGSSPLYDGRRLAEKGDVVVITVNHRLNAFGYLYLPLVAGGALPDSGNAGMWDLVLALEWVRDNAATFGGDPGRVMVFGQSGGGAKIATLMAAPAAMGFFHAAATMSGQQVTASGPLNASERARAFLDALSVSPGDVAALKSLPAERLVEALATPDPIGPDRGGVYFGPVLDERFLSRHPFWPDAPAQSAEIPMILGNTKDETRNLIGAREPDAFDLRWEDLPARLAAHMRVDIHPGHVVETYRRLYPDHSPSDVFFAATTAARSWRGQVEESDARARQGAPTWVYQMDLASPLDGGKWGAPHTIDIAHAFDNTDKPGSLTGTGAAARRVADELSRAFIALARHGDPNHSGLPRWDRHTLPERQTMVFDETTRLMNDPRKGERALFAKVPFTQWGT
ncbi:carboxylesterase/lipase family protein [Amphiplicatus metriothermophilus]|uniref:Carboxylic ester hydrolase n=1 Tax=Amphiplicatus metriothermophilus TaxID=1519374 RepID=A0A239PV20_9PROT|nr:carboxylesterase/lipase family protein [Amphiplicatus metriothermophilus]MBB5519391.1 para-nitrobenzyl esterase [Amphiplicatus metriothermophilus]SNT73527.1 para-nitrobenzyl esterase [Amphiplicatus metriothermophilus]